MIDALNIEDVIATRKLIADKKKQWAISPLNLYEIFGNSNPERREVLIYKMSALFPKPGIIFDIPTRIIFGEILSYYPEEQTKFEKDIRNSWFDIVKDNKKTFIADFDNFKQRISKIEIFTNTIKYIIKNKSIIYNGKDDSDEVKSVLEYLKILVLPDYIKNEESKIKFYVSSVIIFAIFCFGIEADFEFIDQFWKDRIDEDKNGVILLKRFVYLCNEYDYGKIISSAQIKLMTEYFLYESNNKGIRKSTFADALHLIYSFYCMFFISDDTGIINFSKNNVFLKKRVYSFRENHIFNQYYIGNNMIIKKYFLLKIKIKDYLKKLFK